MSCKKLSTLTLCLVLSGCGSSAVLVEPGTPVRLSEDTTARVYVRDETGQWVKGTNKVTLPAGWYVLPPPATKPSH